jgi:hypothetical protein
MSSLSPSVTRRILPYMLHEALVATSIGVVRQGAGDLDKRVIEPLIEVQSRPKHLIQMTSTPDALSPFVLGYYANELSLSDAGDVQAMVIELGR